MSAADSRAKTGAEGQLRAQRFLEGRGYRTIETNWRCRIGELDLVMLEEATNELVFVEVKTRHGVKMGHAMDSISRKQSANLLNSGQWYVTEHPAYHDSIWRVDIVAITIPRHGMPVIEHEINAVYRDS